jgi:hypothetical protein
MLDTDGDDLADEVMAVLRAVGPDAAPAAPQVARRLPSCAAFQALTAMGEPALPYLRQQLEADDPDVRRDSITAIGRMGATGRGAVDDLLAMADDAEPAVAAALGKALCRLEVDSPAVRGCLRRLLTHAHLSVRIAVAQAVMESRLRFGDSAALIAAAYNDDAVRTMLAEMLSEAREFALLADKGEAMHKDGAAQKDGEDYGLRDWRSLRRRF